MRSISSVCVAVVSATLFLGMWGHWGDAKVYAQSDTTAVVSEPLSPFQDALRTQIDVLQRAGAEMLQAGDAPLYTASTLTRYYETHNFVPVWVTDRGPHIRLHSLRSALRQSHREGLTPSDYHVDVLQGLLADLRAAEDPDVREALLIELEIRATDAFLLYGMHLLSGRVNPVSLKPSWNIEPRQADLLDALGTVSTGTPVHNALQTFRSEHPEYAALVDALSMYRQHVANGGWTRIEDGPTLERESEGTRVAALRTRLEATEALAPVPDSLASVFDDELHEAVLAFQERHGLGTDGVVGPATLRALNVPADQRVEQIRLNLERWRWLPKDLGRRHVLVNIAAFHLKMIDEGEEVLDMRVVVGRPYRQTPVFSDEISYLVFSPFWHVPHSLATRDKLPEFQRDPSAVNRQGFRIFQGWSAQAQPIDPMSIDWPSLTARNFPYRLRQQPGPNNALGQVKFMFPNVHNVYLHDTPTRGTFAQADRGFSSGCIRLEHPMELAEHLLRDMPGWDRERIRRSAGRDAEVTVVLSERVPVHLLYWTSWADADGTVHFRNDVYNRDGDVLTALSDAPEAPAGFAGR